MRYGFSAIVLALVVSVTGCNSPGLYSGGSYSGSTMQRLSNVQLGRVESVRVIDVKGSASGVGAIGGGVAGAVAGSHLGGGRGQIVGAVLGGLAGGVGGNALEQHVTKKKGIEITVKLDGGGLVAVVQAADVPFNVGDRVRVITTDGTARVTH